MIIPTGLYNLDKILNGGLHAGTITDVSGARGTGKFQLVVQTILNALTSVEKNVLYQHTAGNFSSEYLRDNIRNRDMDENIMDRIKVMRITDSMQQASMVDKLDDQYSLIVVGSVAELFSFEYGKKDRNIEKNIEFMRYMHKLAQFAIHKKIPILVVNTTRYTQNVIAENMAKSISMYTHTRIHLEKNDSGFSYTVLVLDQYKTFKYKKTPVGLEDADQDI